MNEETEQVLNTFIAEWKDTTEKNRDTFLHFKDYLTDKEGVSLDFIARPGVTYSLRGVHKDRKRQLNPIF